MFSRDICKHKSHATDETYGLLYNGDITGGRMGFWSTVNKLLQGKPVFEDEPNVRDKITGAVAQTENGVEPVENRFVDEHDKKIIPEVAIEHVTSHLHGGTFITTAWIKNLSKFEIELDKITALSIKIEIDRRLRPQQAHEITLYNGPILKDDHNHKAILQYKIVENGDYFSAEYTVEFKYESDGTYIIKALRPNYGVRDI